MMAATAWLRIAEVLRRAGQPSEREDAERVALSLRARKVPVIRDGGRWRVQAGHPLTVAWLDSIRPSPDDASG
jgi:hypothetical protein